jgi:hypothetical protein
LDNKRVMVPSVRLLLLILLSLMVSCTQKPAAQDSCNFVQNTELQRVSWKSDVPISIYVHESFPAEQLPALRNAFKHWEDKLGRPLFKQAGVQGGPKLAKRDGVSAIYWMDEWEADKSGEQARTTIYWENTQIKEADMKLNVKDFTLSSKAPLNGTEIDLESLLVHELGHVLGLQHNTTTQSVMAVILSYLEVRQEPYPVDVSSLKCEY